MTDDEIDAHLDAVLRASGSALKYYSMHSTREAMRSAMRAAVAVSQSSAESLRALLADSAQYVTDAGLLAAIQSAIAQGGKDDF